MLRLRLAGGHDPWWDLEGRAAKRSRLHKRVVTDFALAFAVVACGLTSAAWLSQTGIMGIPPLA